VDAGQRREEAEAGKDVNGNAKKSLSGEFGTRE
jgi:hypothetical protein